MARQVRVSPIKRGLYRVDTIDGRKIVRSDLSEGSKANLAKVLRKGAPGVPVTWSTEGASMPRERKSKIKSDTRAPMSVQTLIFRRSRFPTPNDAREWIQAQDGRKRYKKGRVVTKGSTYHIRQVDPREFEPGSFRTVVLTDGVDAVMGHKLGARRMTSGERSELSRKAARERTPAARKASARKGAQTKARRSREGLVAESTPIRRGATVAPKRGRKSRASIEVETIKPGEEYALRVVEGGRVARRKIIKGNARQASAEANAMTSGKVVWLRKKRRGAKNAPETAWRSPMKRTRRSTTKKKPTARKAGRRVAAERPTKTARSSVTKRGFAAMSPRKRREVARKGAATRARKAKAGKRGGGR